MRTEVIVSIFIQGFHYWEDARESVNFLRHEHFHNFKIVAYVEVDHSDRQIEFFEFAEKLRQFISKRFPNASSIVTGIDFGTMSCEQIALVLVEGLDLSACEVWEDELVGSKVYA